LVPLDRRVSVRVRNRPVLDALRDVLDGTDLEPKVARTGQVMLVRRAPVRVNRDTAGRGTVVGRVTDVKTGEGLNGADGRVGALGRVPAQVGEVGLVVTGGQRIRGVGGLVGRIDDGWLVREAPIANVTELLTARVTGVLVQQNQGTVGGDVPLRIRSPNSTGL